MILTIPKEKLIGKEVLVFGFEYFIDTEDKIAQTVANIMVRQID